MPQSSQFIGVNSVTNIELNSGYMPAPIVRNADWLEICTHPHHCRVQLYRACKDA